MERAFSIGCRVIFFDEYRRHHEAIVTNWFHGGPEGQTVAEVEQQARDRGVTAEISMPCCNIVLVSPDKMKEDTYGRQIERHTSVPHGRHMGSTPFLGMCWAWPDELEEAIELASKAL